jgi:predicted lipid-binding transport protein (Tim44 family)
MQDAFDPTTIIFAALAIFVLFKLRSILGTRTGEERPPYNPFERPAAPPAPEGGDNVIRLPGAAQYEEPQTPEQRWGKFADTAAIEGLEAIAAADSQFSGKGFVDGARAAYEMIVLAFAQGNKDTLKDLLASDVFDSFANAINTRVARGEKVDTTFVSIDSAQIADAHLRGKIAQITMRFTSKIITVTRNANDEVVDGNPDRIVDVVDVWTFAREAGASDPNWKLVATEAAH